MINASLRRLMHLSFADRRGWRAALGLLLVATVADTAGPLLVSHYLSDCLARGEAWSPTVAGMLVLYLVLLWLAAVCTWQQALRLSAMALSVISDLRKQAFSRLLRHPVAFFDSTPLGSIVSRVTQDTDAVKELFVQVLSSYIQNAFRVIGVFVAMAILDLRLMWISALFLPVVFVVMTLYRRLSTPIYQCARALLADINAQVAETLQGIRIVQLFQQEARFARQFGDTVQAHFGARRANLWLDATLLRPLVDLVHALVMAGIVLYFGSRALGAPADIGVIYAFIAYLGRFTEPVIEITQRLNIVQQACVAADRVFALVDAPSVPQEGGSRTLPGGDIVITEVSYRYPGALSDVVSSLSLRIPEGATVGIVGHTGCGKSTLASLLLRFYAPRTGAIRWGDIPYEHIDNTVLRSAIGWVPQDAFLFPGSVWDNIVLDASLQRQDVIALLEGYGLWAMMARLPDGLDTVLGERASTLSSGERQCVALARALVRQPRLLILDEATASLDSESERHIQTALQTLRGKLTLVVIAHRLSTIAGADSIVVMQRGRVCEAGTHAVLMERRGVYNALYQMQHSAIAGGLDATD